MAGSSNGRTLSFQGKNTGSTPVLATLITFDSQESGYPGYTWHGPVKNPCCASSNNEASLNAYNLERGEDEVLSNAQVLER